MTTYDEWRYRMIHQFEEICAQHGIDTRRVWHQKLMLIKFWDDGGTACSAHRSAHLDDILVRI